MNLDGNARLTQFQRTSIFWRVREEEWTVQAAAAAAGCSPRTAHRWLARDEAGESLEDRSSGPHWVPGRTPKAVEQLIEKLGRLRFTSTRIAAELGMAVSTVGAVLARLGLNRLSKLQPPEPRTVTAAGTPASSSTSMSRSSGSSECPATG